MTSVGKLLHGQCFGNPNPYNLSLSKKYGSTPPICTAVCPPFVSPYRHIRNYYLSNSKTFQDGNGNCNFGEMNSNDFQDGNWEPMEMKG